MSATRTREAIAAAMAELGEWRDALATAQGELAAADAAPATPADVAAVGAKAAAAQAAASAAGRGVEAARDRARAAWAAHLTSEADAEDRRAQGARKRAAEQAGRVKVLTDQLAELEGIAYGPAPQFTETGDYHIPLGKAGRLEYEAEVHELRALVLRTTAERGTVPTFRRDVGLPLRSGWPDQLYGEHMPEVCGEFASAMAELDPPPPVEEVPDSGPGGWSVRVDYPSRHPQHELVDRLNAAAGY